MEEKTYRKYDVAIKLLAIAGAIASFWVAFLQHNETKEKEYKVNYWNGQLKTCQSGAELITQTAIQIYNNKMAEKNTIEKMYQLSYGEARLFLNEKSLDTLQDVMQQAASCSNNKECDYHQFNVKPLLFTQQCREFISKSWNLSLEKIGDGKKWVHEKNKHIQATQASFRFAPLDRI